MTEIAPNRDNWRMFCETKPLTDGEWEEWYSLAEAVINNEDLGDAFFHATDDEFAEMQNKAREHTTDWRDIVASADAHRQLVRAALAWGQKMGVGKEVSDD